MQTEDLTGAQSKRARHELGMSQQDVAKKSGLGRTQLSWLEGKKYTPDDDFVRKLRSFYEEQGVDFSQDEPVPESKPGDREQGPDDEVNRKRREQAQPPATKNGRRNNYRGGLRVHPDISETRAEVIFEKIDANEQRIAELLEQEMGDGVSEGGFWPFSDGMLHLEGEDRIVGDQLMHLTAANYMLVRMLRGEVVPPADHKVVRKPWKAATHEELLRAQLHPYMFGPVKDPEPGEEDGDEDEDSAARQRREQMHAVQ